jgi:UDP-N-acetylglucosamine acyltransferase
MNRISKFARIAKGVRMGVGNVIGENVYIGKNVILGNNNKFYPNTRICPNVEIGDGNVFLENNTIGDQAVLSTAVFTEKKYNGVTIGNNNLFYFENRVDSGSSGKTQIGSSNKFLSGVHVGHDTYIGDHVYIYPKVLISGYSTLLDYCGIGTLAGVQQRTVVGSYSFVGMVTASTSHKFPFYIYIGNKPVRLNLKRCPDGITAHKDSLDLLCSSHSKMNKREYYNAIEQYPDEFRAPLVEFFERTLPNTAM